MSSQKLHFLGRPKVIPPISRRAAQYIRMSTDHQRYSIENQKEVIARYARFRGIDIVRTYVDAGRSGLTIELREGLKQLISEVRTKRANFNVILVFDVSRWGRFQDVDESAHYEFVCKSAGVPVEYCDEVFENDGSIYATLFKGLKRAMAGEFSRELSVRISASHHRFARKGFSQGGVANYGLRRVLVDYAGRYKMALLDGQQKGLREDHVVLAPGPPKEIQIVRDIFRMFVTERMKHKQIARALNERGLYNRRGKPWSGCTIGNILRNEKYVGTFVYNQSSWKMQTKRIYNPSDKWIRVESAFEPIIDKALFDEAQSLLSVTWALSDNDLLDYLSALFCVKGYLSCAAIKGTKCGPTYTTYRERFGNFPNALRQIGYKQSHSYRYDDTWACLRRIDRQLTDNLISGVMREGGRVDFNETAQHLIINETLTVGIMLVPYARTKFDVPGWRLYTNHLPKSDVILLTRTTKSSAEKILDYHLIPRVFFTRQTLQLTDRNIKQFKQFKLLSLSEFYERTRRDYVRKPQGLFINFGSA